MDGKRVAGRDFIPCADCGGPVDWHGLILTDNRWICVACQPAFFLSEQSFDELAYSSVQDGSQAWDGTPTRVGANGQEMILEFWLRRRGWPKGILDEFRQTPDETTPAGKLYSWHRVRAVEGSTAFIRAKTQERRDREEAKRNSVRQRSATATANAEAAVARLAIRVESRLLDDVIAEACEQYNRWKADWRRSLHVGDFLPAHPDGDPAIIARLTVNHLRHRLTTYTDESGQAVRPPKSNQGKKMIRLLTLDAIAAAYPHLAGECERQKAVAEESVALR